MDLGAIQDAPALVLARGTMAATRNAQELLHDARVLAAAGSRARAYSLAVLAVEEAGKAGNLALLTALPTALRAQARSEERRVRERV